MDRVRHKESNRFKFQSFAERISNINIDVFHRVPHRNEEDEEDTSTYFYQSVQKWCILNLTENFKSFRQEIGYEISTLPQLINHKERIASVFLKHIKLQNILSLQPVLELLIAFVKDIRYEFYEFYPEVLKELIILLKVKDPEILELTFTCLAYLFKYLSRELVKDLDKVLLDLAPLFNDNNPVYIRDFAAQSFAFVARKVKDKEKLLLLLLQTVQSSPHLLQGISQLTLHTLCGIKGQSHSCAEKLLHCMLNGFGDDKLPQKLLFLLASNVSISYGNTIGPQHSVFFPVVHRVLKEKIEKDGISSKSIKKLLKIIKVGLQCKSGANLQESLIPELMSCITKLLLSSDVKVKKLCAEICGDVLVLDNLKLPQEIASLMIIKVLDIKDEEILVNFMEQVSTFAGFETLVLPQALQIFCSLESQSYLKVLSKIIVNKTEPQMKSYDILNAPIYNITLRSGNTKLGDKLLKILEKFNPHTQVTDDILSALIIVRHITWSDRKVISTVILKIICETVKFIGDNHEDKEKHIFVLCTAFESLLYFKDNVNSEDINFISDIFQLLLMNKSLMVLRIVNVLLTVIKKIEVSENMLLETYQNLKSMTQSPHSYVRFLALHSLQSLEKLGHNSNGKQDMVEVLNLCLNAEAIPLTIVDYREKIKELQKLRYDGLPPLNNENYQVLICYLLGVLYCNFKLLWEPTFEILASYATKVPKIFWGVFHKQLTSVTQMCKEKKFPNDVTLPAIDLFFLKSVRFLIAEEKADYNNYRYLLWKSMTLFADLCESKNRDVVSLYLTFLEEELFNSSPRHNLAINIKQKEATEGKEEISESPNTEEPPVKKSNSNIIKWAVAHLTLLSNFKSPKLCYKESEVRNSYYGLLEHKNVEIQKLALECLFTYKFKYMMPYKNNLRNLVDEVKFRDEIVHFQIDKENGIIQESHREELMPIVMRILYNKMLSRSAVKRGSKGSAALLKRSVVFRFLAGCSEKEMEVFLQMAFRTFQGYNDADSEGFVKVMNTVDLEHITPPKKLLSVVNLINVILEHFGGLMTVNIQRYILKILFSVGAITSGIFGQREKIFSGYVASVKSLRVASSDCLGRFFDRLSFPWAEDEINTVFEIFIWNYLEKLPSESLYNPTSVLKLFSTWSENPRYFKLFVRHKKYDQSVSALPFITALLLNEKTQSSVTSYIIRIIENLLTLKEGISEENEDEAPLEIDYLLPIDEAQLEKLSLKEELNYGSKILIRHVSSILTYLRRRLQKSNNVLDKTELSVLSKVTELATSPENSDTLMTILLRLLTFKKMTDEEILMDMMTTIENLAKIVNKPSSYLKSFAVLLCTVESADCRKMLMNALTNVQRRCPELNECLSVILDLNANDSKSVNQPDFDKRLDAYKKIKTLATKGKIDLDFGLLILHNCFYVVRCDTDLSLSDSASHCLKEICPILTKSWEDNQSQNQFWIDSILRIIHLALIGKDEKMQNFAISLLGVMARECGNQHPVLKDLCVYSNKADPEVDLFENAVHLQGHRRIRSLLRFVSLSKTLKKAPNTRTLSQFILPMATRYLCNQNYVEKNTLIDAAISCLGAVCRYLPWNRYQTILRYYLLKLQGKIDCQKQLVRIVIAILDSFHFDISKAECSPAAVVSGEKPVNENGSLLDKKGTPEDDESSDIDEDEKKDLEDELHQDKDTEEVNEENMEINIAAEESSVLETITILSPAEATRVQRAMSESLLTQLTKAIGERTQKDDTHKTNMKSLGPDRDTEDVLRIPIAVTLVKLLQKISKKMLDDHLSGIIMKLCTFLKSKMESVRTVARETLEQIIVSIGPKYLNVIFGELKSVLTKGFQLHVLVFTMHSVLHAVQAQLQPGDVDENLQILLQACKNDIFGQPSEEKDVKQIQVKHKEVKSTKSYRLMNIIAQHITEKCLTDILLPIKEALETSHSHKAITKCRECLRHIVLGICANEFISNDSLFIYVYGVASESIPKLSASEKVEVKKDSREKRDCFIIPEEPKNRTGVLSNPVKKNPKSNSHILLEFAFQLLQFILKKDKLQTTPNFKSFLNPLGGELVKAVQSQHIKVSTLALNCLCKIFKYNLLSIRREIRSVINELYAILHKYAAPGLSKGETFDLVLVAFKTLCIIIRDTNHNGLNMEKLKILLVYVEQDIYDNHRQASAFNVLKTILKKKLDVPELNSLIKKVAELSISSEVAHVRLQARQSVFQYIMDYPLGDKLEYFIGFYISQLSFAAESGRQSALEMIYSFITHFPQKVLYDQCGVFLITLGARLINDDSPECKKAVSGIVKSMLLRLDGNYRDQLFDVVTMWLKQKNINHRRLSAQIIGIFVTIEKTAFARRLPDLLPLIHSQFSGESIPGKFVRLFKDEDCKHHRQDYHLFQVLQLLLKICSHCPQFLTDPQNQESLSLFAETCQNLLCHPHEWVRLASVQFLGSLLNSIDASQMAKVLNGRKVKTKLSFLEAGSLHRRVRSLVLDHVSQLIPNSEIGEEFIEQVTKNLVYFARVLKDVGSKTDDGEKEEIEEKDEEVVNDAYDKEDSKEGAKNLSLLWLIRKMRRVVNSEVVETPLSYTLRTGVLKWIGAITVCFSKEELMRVLYHLIAPVVRERDLLAGEHSQGPFKTLVTDVTQLIKKKVGIEEFTREAVKVQKRLLVKRTERRTQKAQEFVTNPERAAKRKIEKQVKKKLLKKRKIESFKAKGIRNFTRKRKAEDDIF